MNSFDRPEYEDMERVSLLKHIPHTATRILDVGCNTGAFGRALKRDRTVEVWGVEPDPVAASVARKRLDHVINDVFQLGNPLPDHYFDLIAFNDSLEHMHDPSAALNLAIAKLQSGGRIHCCVPNMRHIANLEHLLFEKDWRYEEFGVRDRTHLRFFTRKSIRRLFEGSGLEVLEMIGMNEDWWRADARLRRWVFRLFPGFTQDMRYIQYLVIARKG